VPAPGGLLPLWVRQGLGPGRNDAFRTVITERRVTGPVVVTHTRNDGRPEGVPLDCSAPGRCKTCARTATSSASASA
jgi:hypothetical protein